MSNNARTEIRIAYIGGGSRGWAISLMKDLALSEHLTGQLVLYDIDHAAAEANVARGKAIFGHKDAKSCFKVEAVKTLRTALRGADFVLISIEPGPVTMRYADLEIPLKYDIIQTVGDTVGPGGICRALRSVPMFEGFARQIMTHCPNAWVINFTNPLTVCTATLYHTAPDIKAFGCCHEVFATQFWLGELVKKHFKVPKPPREEIVLDIAGVNHFTFATHAEWNGEDLLALEQEQIARKRFFASKHAATEKASRKGEWWNAIQLVSRDLLRRFGAMGAAGERHLVEFVPWYIPDRKTMFRWGVLPTMYKHRVAWARRKPVVPGPNDSIEASGEESAKLMAALCGLGDVVSNVNVPNRGQVVGLQSGAIVESYAQFRRDEVRPITARPLPAALESLERSVIDEQQLTLRAAAERDQELALQAILMDSLVHLPTDRAHRMLTDMLEHTREFLPGWKIG